MLTLFYLVIRKIIIESKTLKLILGGKISKFVAQIKFLGEKVSWKKRVMWLIQFMPEAEKEQQLQEEKLGKPMNSMETNW